MSTTKVYKPNADTIVVADGGKLVVQAGGRIVIEEGGSLDGAVGTGPAAAPNGAAPQPAIAALSEKTTVAETAGKVNSILAALVAAGILANKDQPDTDT